MSIKLTTQMDWMNYSSYSKYHPDNMDKKPYLSLPQPLTAPAPVSELTELDKKMTGAWGSKLCCERPYGKNETRTWIKDGVTPKIGSSWGATLHAQYGKSRMQSAMYSSSLKEPSFKDMIASGFKQS